MFVLQLLLDQFDVNLLYYVHIKKERFSFNLANINQKFNFSPFIYQTNIQSQVLNKDPNLQLTHPLPHKLITLTSVFSKSWCHSKSKHKHVMTFQWGSTHCHLVKWFNNNLQEVIIRSQDVGLKCFKCV